MKRLTALVLAAGAALSAPAFAETVTYYLWDPVTRSYVQRSVDRPEPAATYVAPSVTYSAPPSTTTYVTPETTTYVAPSVTYYETVRYEPAPLRGPDIVVTAPRATNDQLITGEVMDRIASDPSISGRIGVETYRNDVTLTGRVATQGQADRAERHAKAVPGVDEVTNLVRGRVGSGF
jgi:hypothetical protein